MKLSGVTLHGEASPPMAGQSLWPDHDDRSDEDAHAALHRGFTGKRKLLGKILSRCISVRRTEGMTPCLEWTGPTSGAGRGGGYGRFSFEGRTCSVHRTVYQIVYGPIPPRKQVDHECCNRLCCNPDHLQCTTHKKNQKLRDRRRNQ